TVTRSPATGWSTGCVDAHEGEATCPRRSAVAFRHGSASMLKTICERSGPSMMRSRLRVWRQRLCDVDRLNRPAQSRAPVNGSLVGHGRPAPEHSCFPVDAETPSTEQCACRNPPIAAYCALVL